MQKSYLFLLLLTMLLLPGCAGQHPVPPQPADSVAAPAPARSEPVPPAAPSADRYPLPRLDTSQVHHVEVWRFRPERRRILLRPADQGALISGMLDAVNAADAVWHEGGSTPEGVHVIVRFRTGESLSLALPANGGPVAVDWEGKPLVIDSPALSRALAALEPELARAQKPGLGVWAVDLTGSQAPELLLEQTSPLTLYGISPDGRYLLLVHGLGELKSVTGLPYVLDRTTGQLAAGRQTSMRSGTWSGRGFYVDRLAHLDLTLNETHYDQLAGALDLKTNEREAIAASFSPDGKRVAVLVGRPWNGEPLDLVQGSSDGTGLSVVPKAVTGMGGQTGTAAGVALSPDGRYLAITGKDGAAIVRTADPDPQHWVRIPGGGAIAWAPDSRHVWFGAGGVVDLTGKSVFNAGQVHNLLWQPVGQGGVVNGYDFMQSFRLDGALIDLKVPDWSIPAGFLPDGRLVVWCTAPE